MPLFRLGDHGSAVAEIRTILVGRGLLAPDGPSAQAGQNGSAHLGGEAGTRAWRPTDAVFDEACDRAVRAFQQERGLIVDGIVGPATYRALREASYQLGARVLAFRFSAPMVGDDVAALQSRLQNLGYYTSLVDGIFGETTHHAVCLYQSEYGLTSDGICGPATLRSLERLGTRVTGGSPYAIRQEEQVRRSGPQLSGKRVLIDPGSGGLHPLSTGELAERESHLLWDLGARLEGRMAAAGMQTFLSHDGHGRPGDDERARVANRMDADLMISLRCAYYENTRANGAAAFYFGNNNNSYSTIGRNLAGYIQREIVARTPLADCRTHQRTWDVLRLTRMPVALIDVGYITNPNDAAVLADSDWRNVIAEAILVAVKRVYLLGQDDRPTGTYTFAELLAAENSSR